MCKPVTTQEKKVIAVFTVANVITAAYPAYSIYKGVSALTLAKDVAGCVCATFGNITSTCQASVTSLVGPGLQVSNVAVFCKDTSSAVNAAISSATSTIAMNSILTVAVLAGGAFMTWKTIKNLREKLAEAQLQNF